MISPKTLRVMVRCVLCAMALWAIVGIDTVVMRVVPHPYKNWILWIVSVPGCVAIITHLVLELRNLFISDETP